MSVKIYIARHGQNEDNVNNILNGHRDLPLTDLGRSQAKELGEAIKAADLTFDAVYCSPLSRAKETAKIVAEILELPNPTVYDELIERDFGIMTGKTANDIVPMCAPDIIQAEIITYFLSPEDAETFPDLVERGKKVLEFISAKHTSGKVLLVTHGDIGKMIYAAATGKNWRDVLVDFHFGNGDLIDISAYGEAHKVKLTQYNH
jgi:broad specificity phosphatase PhoE